MEMSGTILVMKRAAWERLKPISHCNEDFMMHFDSIFLLGRLRRQFHCNFVWHILLFHNGTQIRRKIAESAKAAILFSSKVTDAARRAARKFEGPKWCISIFPYRNFGGGVGGGGVFSDSSGIRPRSKVSSGITSYG